MDRLADRELEVFELIGRGLTTREIGAKLGLGVTTVDTYRSRIKEKLTPRERGPATRGSQPLGATARVAQPGSALILVRQPPSESEFAIEIGLEPFAYRA